MQKVFVLLSVMLFFLTKTTFAQENLSNKNTSAHNAKSTTAQNKFKIEKKNFYYNVTALYGIITDGGINGSSFANVLNPGTQVTDYLPVSKPNAGFRATLGYKLDPNAVHSYAVIYTHLNTSGTTTAGTPNGLLFNNFTQLGNDAAPGFHIWTGPTTASGKLSYGYDAIDLYSLRPLPDDGGTSIKFSRGIGLSYIQISKKFYGNYSGYIIPNTPTSNSPIAAQDKINYSANYYGLGGELRYDAIWALTPNFKIKGGGSGGVFAGIYSSNFSENAVAASAFSIDPDLPIPPATNYSDREGHASQAWTPAIFAAQIGVVLDLINKPPSEILSIEFGLFLETTLPLTTNDAIGQNLGSPLDKLNNDLNLASMYLALNYRLD